MSKPRAFRPTVGDELEQRTVPTSPGGLLGSLIGSVPAQDSQLVAKAFNSFVQTYFQDVRTILLAPGTTNPADNRDAFNSAVGTALTQLNSTIDMDISNLSTASSLDATIMSELLGTGAGSTSLQAELAKIATPKGTHFPATRDFVRQSLIDIGTSESQIIKQVRSAPAPTGTISTQTVFQDLMQIGQAFQTFFQTYFTDVNTILLPAGTTDPSTNRAAFNTAIGTALNTLNSSVASALSNLPSSLQTSLGTTLQNDLLTGTSTTGTSLQARLAAITSPTSASGFAPFIFRVESWLNIQFAENRTAVDFITAVRQFNQSLGSGTM